MPPTVVFPARAIGDTPPLAPLVVGVGDLNVETKDCGCDVAIIFVDDVGVVLPPPRLPDELVL